MMSFTKLTLISPTSGWGSILHPRFCRRELHAAVVNTCFYVVVTMFAAAILAFSSPCCWKAGAPSALYSNRHLFTGGYQRGDRRRNVAHFV